MTRREFILAEDRKLLDFVYGDLVIARQLVSYDRVYQCGCGFECRAPRDIFDHSAECSAESK